MGRLVAPKGEGKGSRERASWIPARIPRLPTDTETSLQTNGCRSFCSYRCCSY